MESTDEIIATMIRMHEWRDQYNKENIGYGLDPYQPDRACHYAEAYALWGQGYVSLYKLTGEDKYLQLAERCTDWLMEHVNPGYKHPSWGLPWKWKRWNASQTLSYLITTVFCGQLFYALYKQKQDKRYLDLAEQVAQWIECENGGEECRDGYWFYYANFPALKFPVFNVSAQACGFLAHLCALNDDRRRRKLCLDATRYLIRKQRPDGRWFYAAQSYKTDNVHTGFVLEGMWQTYESGVSSWLPPLIKGTKFYWQNLFSANGFGIERYVCGANDLRNLPFKVWVDNFFHSVKGDERVVETQLWGYGAAIRAFTIASRFDDEWKEKAKLLIHYVRDSLSLGNGSFAYRRTDPAVYIRHQAHIFQSLGLFADYVTQ